MNKQIENIKLLLNDEDFVVDLNSLISKYITEYRTVNIITLLEHDLSFETRIKIYEDGMVLNKIRNAQFYDFDYIHDSSDVVDISKIKEDMIEYAYYELLDKINKEKEEIHYREKLFNEKFKQQIRIKKLKNIIIDEH